MRAFSTNHIDRHLWPTVRNVGVIEALSSTYLYEHQYNTFKHTVHYKWLYRTYRSLSLHTNVRDKKRDQRETETCIAPRRDN